MRSKKSIIEGIMSMLVSIKFQSTLPMAGAIFIGLALATGSLKINPWLFLGLYTIFGIGVSGGAHAINAVSDYSIDKIEHPKRPLPEGMLSKKVLMIWSSLLFCIGLLISLTIKGTFIYAAIDTLFAISYSLPGLELGKKWYSTYLLLALGYTLLPILGAFSAVRQPDMFVVKVAVFFTMIALLISPLKDIPDTRGDKKYGKTSLPVIIGEKNTVIICLTAAVSIAIGLTFALGFFKLIKFWRFVALAVVLFVPFIAFALSNLKRKMNFQLMEAYALLCQILFAWCML